MESDRISLDQVEHQDKFDFERLYDHPTHQTNESDLMDDIQINPTHNKCKYFSIDELKEHFGRDGYTLNKSYSVLALNCRSLTAHWDEFKHLISETSNNDFQFDIIGLSEIFKIQNNFDLCGYHNFIYKNRPDNDDNRGGVGLFIKNNYNYIIREDLSVFIPHVIETLFVEITNLNEKPCIFGIIYRPNTQPKASIDTFSDKLLEIIEQVNRTRKTLCLMGDFNIDLLKYNNHAKTNNFIDNLIANGMIPLVTKPTRITDHSATLIDHVYTNKIDKHIETGIIITDVSDHFGTFSTFSLNKSLKSVPLYKTYRNFSEQNTIKFKDLLLQIDFAPVYLASCPNKAYELFITLYSAAFEKSFPQKIMKGNKKNTKHEPWLTKGLLISSIKKNVLYKTSQGHHHTTILRQNIL